MPLYDLDGRQHRTRTYAWPSVANMKSFCCFAAGEKFPGELNGKEMPVGFFVSVFVNAVDANEAEAKSLDILLKHPDLGKV